jgi:hypothetical protein
MAQITLNSTGVASNGSLVLQSNGTTAAVTIDTSQRAAFVAGTEALPAITTTGDTNTGMWFPAADTIAFSEGGAEAMRIDSDGDVGIGTSSPSDKLTVISAGTQVGSTNFRNIARIGLATNDASVLLGYDVSAGSAILASTNNYPIAFWTSIAGTYAEKMRIDSSGNVGIGTSSPTMKLDISGTSYGGLYIKSTSTNFSGMLLENTNSATKWQIGVEGGLYNTAGILNIGIDAVGSKLVIDSSGNVGIGTSSPTEKCHIYASSGNSFYKFQNAATGSGASDGGFVGIGSGGDVFLYNYEASNTVFSTNNTERMRIDSSGSLLINTTSSWSPGVKLQVYGSAVSIESAGTGADDKMYFRNGNGIVGSIATSGSATSYNTSSDYRLKNITGEVTGAKDFIMALKPKQGTWKADGSKFVGFLAHEFEEVSPTSVFGIKDAVDANGKPIMQSMQASSSEVIANLVAHIQNLETRLAALESI